MLVHHTVLYCTVCCTWYVCQVVPAGTTVQVVGTAVVRTTTTWYLRACCCCWSVLVLYSRLVKVGYLPLFSSYLLAPGFMIHSTAATYAYTNVSMYLQVLVPGTYWLIHHDKIIVQYVQ